MYVNRYVTLVSLLWFLPHQVVAITNTMTLVWFDAFCTFYRRRTRTILYTFALIVKAGFVIGNPHRWSVLRCIALMNVMLLKKLFHLSNTKLVGFDPMMTTGCSMGAYHALNFFLQHPDVFNKVVALSGVYDARFFVGEFGGDEAICKIPHQIISGTKMMVGLSTATVKLRSSYVQVLVHGNKMVFHLTINSKAFEQKNIQLGSLSGVMMSLTIGNGGVNKCLISLTIWTYNFFVHPI